MWYKPKNHSSLATPCMLLFPDRIEENIRRMIRLAKGAERLRPHVKTHKIAEVIELQLHAGINKFKCATLNEVAMVAEAGGADILLAYPLVGPAIALWFDLLECFPECSFAVTVDSKAALRQLSVFAEKQGNKLDLFVDIDNGMHRTGINPEDAYELIEQIVLHPNLRFRGLHIYDGHINDMDLRERKVHCDRDFETVSLLVDRLKEEDIELEELACGGTPTFPIHASYPDRTLCPGTPLLWDAGYRRSIPDLDFLPAAVIAGRVISKSMGQVCMDLGYKSVASEMAHPRLHFMDMEADEFFNHSEEHLVIKSSSAEQLSIGDVVYALPSHICPTMALHEQAYVVRNQQVQEIWRVVARKRSYPL